MCLTKKIFLFCFICFFISGCSFLPHTASQVDTRSVYVWPEQRCPSEVERLKIAPVVTAVGGIFASNLVSAFVGIPATALNEAAAADKAGFTAAGINARFYYRGVEVGKKIIPSPPRCYVLAYTKPVSEQKSWCDDIEFKTSMGDTCKNGKDILDGLQEEKPSPKPLAVPDFYAEIGVEAVAYNSIVLPKIVALYYPKSLLQPASDKPRTININLTMISPTNVDAIKSAQVSMILRGITPGANISADGLFSVETGWTNLPAIKMSKNDPPIQIDEPYLPVTISATLHEVGEPSVFLAAFAKSFSNSMADYTRAITNAILPVK